ncbi:MAG: RES domain-containing protein [Burkholderiaceae bacterium]|nr:MAG: RES domain-containing protein [Burkholderiaceae bacterium]
MPINRICSFCFDDRDLQDWIVDADGLPGCDACKGNDAPTSKFSELCDYIESCLTKYWGSAVEQLPYITAEGGYQGTTWDTYDLLVDEIGLSLPRDSKDQLLRALLAQLTDDTWCEYDWGTLDRDVALEFSWQHFCETVKHKRRFFFHSDGIEDRDSFTPASLLREIAHISEEMGLIGEVSVDTMLWRARPDISKGAKATAACFGPPPVEYALQSNRMNPPGIPMLYLASSQKTALLETRAMHARMGKWSVARALRVLDLRRLPRVPGIFSGADRNYRLGLRFLHHFATDIMMPIERDQRVHVDYLPSQVVTEYLRDFVFETGRLDGIIYGSTVHPGGWNLALFADEVDLGLSAPKWGPCPDPWLRFIKSIRAHR